MPDHIFPHRIITTSHRAAASLANIEFDCMLESGIYISPEELNPEMVVHSEGHVPIPICRNIISSILSEVQYAPSMPVRSIQYQPEHREKEVHLPDFGVSPNSMPESPLLWEVHSDVCVAYHTPISALVTKLLDRKEWRSDPEAMTAIRAEAHGLVNEDTWLENTVIERDELKEWAISEGKKIHIGDLLLLCSIKFAEMPKENQKYKGRICFRGDCAKDEKGAYAIYQELSASPTTIHTANSNLAYGLAPGNVTTQADAIRAYVQSKLNSAYDTYVRIPRELWPQEWVKKGMKQPCCRLNKALYGHPEAGGHWERHLTKAIEECGGKPVQNHPSSFWFKDSKLLLTVYVDDLLLSGPAGAHDQLWKDLRKKINIEDPEPLDRFLGRTHIVS
jgi:hypothetical protein